MPFARSALQVVAALWMLSLTPSAVAAQKEDRFLHLLGQFRLRFQNYPHFSSGLTHDGRSDSGSAFSCAGESIRSALQVSSRRRALIGALIGAGASVPLAKLAHDRFENEAASGPKAAVTSVLLSAGAGALVGLATCH